MISRSARLFLAAPLLPLVQLSAQDSSGGGHAGMAGHALEIPAIVSPALRALIDSTLRGTEIFADRRAAILAGYRRVGMDFPSMGEHWVNPAKLIAGGFDPASPAILTYATINGQPRLLGVVYAVVLGPKERPPVIPGGVGVWHEHNGSIDEESLLPEHGGDEHAVESRGAAIPTRLAILHMWTILPNPAGMFTAENWALPFARAGLNMPHPVPLSAARALALATGGEEYYRRLFQIGTGAPDDLPTICKQGDEAALQSAIVESREIINARVNPASLSSNELAALARTWERLAASVHRGTSRPAGRCVLTPAP